MNLLKKSNSVKPINQIPKAIYDRFEKSAPVFLVCSIVKDQQGNYRNNDFHCVSREDLLKSIAPDHITGNLAIFEIKGKYEVSPALLKREAKEFVEAEKEKQERELYEKLKLKFESQ